MNAHYWAAACLAAVAVIVGGGGLSGAAGTGAEAGGGRTFVGGVERLDPALDALVAPDARVEVLARGYKWAEGPLWKDGGLLFSDVPNNVIWRWTEKEGAREYLRPSGYTGTAPRGGEPGSNGLAVDGKKRLVLCQHGDRRVARLVGPPTTAPGSQPKFETIADRYDGKRLNSPNDVLVRPNGDVYFTDPTYGLEGHEKDPHRELNWSGVYRKPAKGPLAVLDETSPTRTASPSRPTAKPSTFRSRTQSGPSGWRTTSTRTGW